MAGDRYHCTAAMAQMEENMSTWIYIAIGWIVLMFIITVILSVALRESNTEHDRAFEEYLHDRTDRGATNDTKR
jgi:heme/copper-type cytochrome/quinol oxidase subunit 2